MDDNSLCAAGWEEILPLSPDLARRYGLPGGQHAYRKLVHDGTLVALLARDTNGYAFALSHVTHYDPDALVPGRLPTFVEVYATRRVLIPNSTVLMAAVLEPLSFALRLRWERVQSPDALPTGPGLPTTVKCVQVYCEAVTEDVVFGTEDIPNPTPRWPRLPPRDPVGPVPPPAELLGDADLATLEEDDDDAPDR